MPEIEETRDHLNYGEVLACLHSSVIPTICLVASHDIYAAEFILDHVAPLEIERKAYPGTRVCRLISLFGWQKASQLSSTYHSGYWRDLHDEFQRKGMYPASSEWPYEIPERWIRKVNYA
jgi:hypothetical protein